MSSLILASNRARIRKESGARLSTGDASCQVDQDIFFLVLSRKTINLHFNTGDIDVDNGDGEESEARLSTDAQGHVDCLLEHLSDMRNFPFQR